MTPSEEITGHHRKMDRLAMLHDCCAELDRIKNEHINNYAYAEARTVEDCRNLLLAKFGKELQ